MNFSIFLPHFFRKKSVFNNDAVDFPGMSSAGVHFTRILMVTGWLIGPFIICQNTLQAMGAATPALSATVIRQGVIFVPAVLIMKALIGVDGLIWSQPITDILSLAVVIIMVGRIIRKTDFSTPPVVVDE